MAEEEKTSPEGREFQFPPEKKPETDERRETLAPPEEKESEEEKQIELEKAKAKLAEAEEEPESLEPRELSEKEITERAHGPLAGDEKDYHYKASVLNFLFGTKKHNKEFMAMTDSIRRDQTFQDDGQNIHHWPYNRQDHLEGCARVAHRLAKLFGYNEERREAITQAALIHDIDSHWGDVQGAIDYSKKLNLQKRAQELVAEQKVSLRGSGLDSFIVKGADALVSIGETVGIVGYILKKPGKRFKVLLDRIKYQREETK